MKNLVGQKFGKLEVIKKVANTQCSPARPAGRVSYLCHCSCGITNVIAVGRSLVSGSTRSCGCDDKHTLYHPRISSARLVWRTTYAEGMSFEKFYELSQMNCTYCGAKPENITNKFKSRTSNVSAYSIENGDFIYNGLDRINQTLPHTEENCVPCCWPCNDKKGILSKYEFIEWIKKIHHNCFIERVQENPKLQIKVATMLSEKSIQPQAKYHPRITSARQLWSEYDKEFAFEDFIELTQMRCFYCGDEPNRTRNHFKYCKTEVSQYAINNGDFVYNGLDRINNDLSHTKENVIPCCWPCNDRKSDSSKEQFLDWISKTYNYLVKTAHIFTL